MKIRKFFKTLVVATLIAVTPLAVTSCLGLSKEAAAKITNIAITTDKILNKVIADLTVIMPFVPPPANATVGTVISAISAVRTAFDAVVTFIGIKLPEASAFKADKTSLKDLIGSLDQQVGGLKATKK